MRSEKNNISLIWKSFQSGNKEAFAYLYNLYVNDLYRYGTKLCRDYELVKDAIQEVFIDLYIKRTKNKMDPEYLKYYLVLALRRNLIKKLKRNRKLSDENPENELLFEPDYNIENIIIEREEDEEKIKTVRKAIIQLPAKQKEVIYLRFNEALEYDQIANLFGITIESARKQVYRALKTIRESCNKQSVVLWIVIKRK